MEEKHKHLEFIQLVITRLNVNSFLIKGWAVTLYSALFALAASGANLNFVMVTYIAVPVFWGLDAYYLSQERQYRELYKEVAAKVAPQRIDYAMDASRFNIGKNKWEVVMWSGTVAPLYGVLILVTAVVMFMLA